MCTIEPVHSTVMLSIGLTMKRVMVQGEFAVPDDQCMVQFLLTNPAVTIGTIMAAFYFPVAIIVYLYARVYYETQKRAREFGHLQVLPSSLPLHARMSVCRSRVVS